MRVYCERNCVHCCLVAVGFHAGAFECDHRHDVPTLVETRICHVCGGSI